MLKRSTWMASLLLLLGSTAAADSHYRASDLDSDTKVLSLGQTGWELFRPAHRELTMFDIEYLTHTLRSNHVGVGIRYHTSKQVAFDFTFDPLSHSEDVYGPIYDMNVGAAVVSIGFSF